nr:hypothetical protein BaRGS_006919 [Batillaria attramentaria]
MQFWFMKASYRQSRVSGYQKISELLLIESLLADKRLFETEPDLKRLFPKIVRLNEVSQLEMDVDRDMLQRHAVTVMEGLGAAVESLEDSDFLNSVLVSIGQTHVRRNVKPQMLKGRIPRFLS